jgi:hypothetical protein
MVDELAVFEEVVIAQAPPGAVVVGVSISPDGRFGAALTILPTASSYPMDDVFERRGDRWEGFSGGSGTGISWSSVDETSDLGVLRYGEEAPEGATAAVIVYEGREHRVPVRHGHFLFVAWNTPLAEDPRLERLE